MAIKALASHLATPWPWCYADISRKAFRDASLYQLAMPEMLDLFWKGGVTPRDALQQYQHLCLCSFHLWPVTPVHPAGHPARTSKSHRCIPPDQFPGTGCRMPWLIQITGHRGRGWMLSFARLGTRCGAIFTLRLSRTASVILFFCFRTRRHLTACSPRQSRFFFPMGSATIAWIREGTYANGRYPGSATANPRRTPSSSSGGQGSRLPSYSAPAGRGHAEPGRADGEEGDLIDI